MLLITFSEEWHFVAHWNELEFCIHFQQGWCVVFRHTGSCWNREQDCLVHLWRHPINHSFKPFNVNKSLSKSSIQERWPFKKKNHISDKAKHSLWLAAQSLPESLLFCYCCCFWAKFLPRSPGCPLTDNQSFCLRLHANASIMWPCTTGPCCWYKLMNKRYKYPNRNIIIRHGQTFHREETWIVIKCMKSWISSFLVE